MKRRTILLLAVLSLIWPGFSYGSQEVPGSALVYLLGMPVSSEEFKLFTGIINTDLTDVQEHYLQSFLEFSETYPSTMALDREKGLLYITFYGSGTVGVYEATTFELVTTFHIPDAIDVAKIAFSSQDGQNRVYVLEKGTTHVYVFDRDSLEPIPEEEFDLVSPARSIWAAYECLFVADTEGIRCYEDKVPVAIFPVPETINFLQGNASFYPDVILYAIAEVVPKVRQGFAGSWQIETLEFSGTVTISQEGDIAGGDEWTWQDGHKETVLGGGFLSGADGSVIMNVVTTGGKFSFVGVMRQRTDVVSFLDFSAEEETAWSLGFLIKKGQGYSEAEFSGTWSVKGMHVSGILHSDGAGVITGGSLTWQDGREEIISAGTYTIERQTGSMILTLSTDFGTREFTGILSSGRDVGIFTNEITPPTVQKDGPGKDIIVLVKTINANYQTEYLAGTWAVKAMHFWGSITIDTTGKITGGLLVTPEGEMEVTGGSFSFSQGSVVMSSKAVTAGSRQEVIFRVEGVISSYRDLIVFVDPTTSPSLSDRNLGVMVKIDSEQIVTPGKGDEIGIDGQNDILLKIDMSSETRTETILETKGRSLAVSGSGQRVFALCGLSVEGENTLCVFDAATLEKTAAIALADFGPVVDCAVKDYSSQVQLKKVCTSHPEGMATVGEEVTFSVTVTNASATQLASIPLSDLFNFSCLLFLRASPSPDGQKDGELNWEDITGGNGLAAGASTSVEITFLAIRNANPTVNTVLARDVKDIFGHTLPEFQSTCNLIITESQGTITVAKTCLSPGNIQLGENVVFQITITNNSPFAIKTLPFRDRYNQEFFDFVSSSLPLTVISPGQLQSDNLLGEDLLAPGDSLVLTITFQAIKEVNSTVNRAEVYEVKDIYDNVISGNISEVALSVSSFHVSVPGGVTAASYVMVSFPFTPANPDFLATVIDDLGAYDSTRWRLFRWNPDSSPPGYEEYNPDNDFFHIEPGKAYWLLSRFSVTLDGTGTPASTKQDFVLDLRPGWNQIACPFNFPVAWNTVRATMGESSYPASEGHTLWKYSNGEYLPATHLEPGTGYWVWNPDPKEVLRLSIPPLKGNKKTSARKVSEGKAEPQPPAPPGQNLVSSSGDSGGGCFIATACFGSPMASQVQILRRFRDRFLMPHWLGKKFVSFYYRHSPAVAVFLRTHPFFRRTVRMMLVPVVRICQVLLKTTS